jgi:ankyrin repeat protein
MKTRIFYTAAIIACAVAAVLGVKFGYLDSLKRAFNAYYYVSSMRNDQASIKLFSSGTVQEIEEAIKRGTDVNHKLADESNPLFTSVRRNKDPKIIELLLDNGADISSVDSRGKTALTQIHRLMS